MLEWLTVPILACALTHGDTNLPVESRDVIALQEAQAFIAADAPGSPLLTLVAMGYVETRFNPWGSAHDRARGFFGVMQIECSACTREMRLRLLDPVENISFASRLLRRRGSVAAYFWGSTPKTRTGRRRTRHYERLVHRARGIMYSRLLACREIPGGE